MKRLLHAVLLATLGCSSPEADDTAASGTGGDTASGSAGPPTGRLALTFGIDADYRDLMEEPATGPFWGSFYDADDVTGAGPSEGAEALGSIAVASIDLTGEQPTEVLFTSDQLTAEKVVVLGFMDSDGNADPDAPGPDEKDPVTVPGDNRFTIIDGETTEVQVYFGLLRP